MPLTAEAPARRQATLRKRIVSYFVRRVSMAAKNPRNSGAVNKSGTIIADLEPDQGWERLLRYCARPAFAQKRLRQIDAEHLVYESRKPEPGERVSQLLTPLELLNRLATLIPPFRLSSATGIAPMAYWRPMRRFDRPLQCWRRHPSRHQPRRMPWRRKRRSPGSPICLGAAAGAHRRSVPAHLPQVRRRDSNHRFHRRDAEGPPPSARRGWRAAWLGEAASLAPTCEVRRLVRQMNRKHYAYSIPVCCRPTRLMLL